LYKLVLHLTPPIAENKLMKIIVGITEILGLQNLF